MSSPHRSSRSRSPRCGRLQRQNDFPAPGGTSSTLGLACSHSDMTSRFSTLLTDDSQFQDLMQQMGQIRIDMVDIETKVNKVADMFNAIHEKFCSNKEPGQPVMAAADEPTRTQQHASLGASLSGDNTREQTGSIDRSQLESMLVWNPWGTAGIETQIPVCGISEPQGSEDISEEEPDQEPPSSPTFPVGSKLTEPPPLSDLWRLRAISRATTIWLG